MRTLLAILLSLWAPFALAKSNAPLAPDQAFHLSVFFTQPNQLLLRWTIAPHYYLYRDHITVAPTATNLVKIGSIVLPEGQVKRDLLRGTYQVYTHQLETTVPLNDTSQGTLALAFGYQGCAEEGFCYAPIKRYLKIDLKNLTPPQELSAQLVGVAATVTTPVSEQQLAEAIFNGHSFFMIVLSFLGLGLLLSLTPCVLPMVPILSGIIMGHRHRLTTMKTFLLSFSYVLGMAITYAIAGMVVALIGSRVQTELQRPWIIIVFSALFVLLAFSLFGLYELRLPNAWLQRLTTLSSRQKGGTYVGVFIMGGLSSLIVSPCVSAPLVGVLAYIAHTGDVFLGAVALLALGFGMGAPLLLIGASAGKLLPKAGRWMVTIERVMGTMMLALAIWLLSRIITGPETLFLWGLLAIFIAVYFGAMVPIASEKRRLSRSLSVVVFIYGIILIIGAALGNSDWLHPWENWQWGPQQKAEQIEFNYLTIKNMQQFNNQLQLAKQQRKPVMLDFYADWCASCVKMERTVFNRPTVRTALSDFMVLRLDVTTNNSFDQAILKRFNVIAPPTFLFFNREGKELDSERMIGEQTADEFIAHLMKIK